MKPILTSICLIPVIACLFTTSAHANEYDYFWTSGQSGYAGEIVLDSPSSSGGTVNDIVSITITAGGIGPEPFFSNAGYTSSQPFTWTPTMITSMDLSWVGYGLSFEVTANGPDSHNSISLREGPGSFILHKDENGYWAATPFTSVPDHTSTFALLLLPLAALGFFSLRQRVSSQSGRVTVNRLGGITARAVSARQLRCLVKR
jgi:hypothetical protein